MVVHNRLQREVRSVAHQPEHIGLTNVLKVVRLVCDDLLELVDVLEELDTPSIHSAQEP